MSTILGGTGADTLDFNGNVSSPPSLVVPIRQQHQLRSTVDESTVRGGTGADTLK